MKSLIFATLFMTSLFAQARSLQPVETLPVVTAQLEKFAVYHNYIAADGGHITIDGLEGIVSLELYDSSVCAQGENCLHYIPSSINIELPFIRSYRDDCGSTVYIAEKDQRPADGQLQTLTVTDHTTIHCKIWHVNQTEVEYTTVSARGQETIRSFFAGGRLGPLYVLH